MVWLGSPIGASATSDGVDTVYYNRSSDACRSGSSFVSERGDAAQERGPQPPPGSTQRTSTNVSASQTEDEKKFAHT